MLGATPERLLCDPAALGCLFESLAVRDLRIYGQAERAKVFHYRDNTGLEVDAVIERDDGAWIAAEVKLNRSPKAVDKAAKSLLRLTAKTTRQRSGSLACLLVITPTGPAYRRPDGVQVTPDHRTRPLISDDPLLVPCQQTFARVALLCAKSLAQANISAQRTDPVEASARHSARLNHANVGGHSTSCHDRMAPSRRPVRRYDG